MKVKSLNMSDVSIYSSESDCPYASIEKMVKLNITTGDTWDAFLWNDCAATLTCAHKYGDADIRLDFSLTSYIHKQACARFKLSFHSQIAVGGVNNSLWFKDKQICDICFYGRSILCDIERHIVSTLQEKKNWPND